MILPDPHPEFTGNVSRRRRSSTPPTSIHGVGRFRVNVFQQRGSIGAVLRAIPHSIPAFASLGLPDVVAGFAELRRGLVLVTGPTGSGKSTSLAALVDIINPTKPCIS